MSNIYIIGSISDNNKNYIIECVKMTTAYLLNDTFCDEKTSENLRYVKPEPNKDIQTLISERYSNIEWADMIVAVTKPDGSIGVGTSYEIEYANRIGKFVVLYRP